MGRASPAPHTPHPPPLPHSCSCKRTVYAEDELNDHEDDSDSDAGGDSGSAAVG